MTYLRSLCSDISKACGAFVATYCRLREKRRTRIRLN